MTREPKRSAFRIIAIGVVACALMAAGALAQTTRVFVTSTTNTADLGGLAGADATCNSLDSAAGLGGNWVAWLLRRLSTRSID